MIGVVPHWSTLTHCARYQARLGQKSGPFIDWVSNWSRNHSTSSWLVARGSENSFWVGVFKDIYWDFT